MTLLALLTLGFSSTEVCFGNGILPPPSFVLRLRDFDPDDAEGFSSLTDVLLRTGTGVDGA